MSQPPRDGVEAARVRLQLIDPPEGGFYFRNDPATERMLTFGMPWNRI